MRNGDRGSRQLYCRNAVMGTVIVGLIAASSTGASASARGLESGSAAPQSAAHDLVAVPGLFEENRGQHDAAVAFSFSVRTYDALFMRDGITLRARDGGECRISFPPASRPAPTGVDQRPATINYFRGSDPTQWRKEIALHRRITYHQYAPGVDLTFTAHGDGIEYEWLHREAAAAGRQEPEWIVACEGGALTDLLQAGIGALRLTAVRHRPEDPREAAADAGPAGIQDQHRPASLTHSTLLGGVNGHEWAEGVAMMGNGDIVVTGSATSSALKTSPGVLQRPHAGGTDLFVARFTSAGELVFLTYLGGGDNETHRSQIAVDGSSIYLVAGTRSSNFPTTSNAHRSRFGGGSFDGVFARLSLDGGELLYSTFIGGSGDDRAFAITLAGSRIVIGGRTDSSDFPIVGMPPQSVRGGGVDGFVAVYDESRLVASTYLGGGGEDVVRSIEVDRDGLIFVSGTTASRDFPTTEGALQRSYGGGDLDAFVMVYSADLSRLHASTYLGGSQLELLREMALHPDSGVVVVGFTLSSDFPTTPASLQPGPGGAQDGFVTHVLPDTSLQWSTFIGGSGDDEAAAVASNQAGELWIAGATRSSDLPIIDRRHQSQLAGGYDTFLLRLTPDGKTTTYSALLGGALNDAYSDMVTGADGAVWAVGGSYSVDFPSTPDAFQPRHSGDLFTEAVIVKFVEELPPLLEVTASFRWTPGAPSVGEQVRFLESTANAEAWLWSFGDGTTSNERQPTHIYRSSGRYQVSLTASNGSGSVTRIRDITVTDPATSFSPRSIIPGQARTGGAAGAFFRSTLWITNPSAGESVFRLRFDPAPGTPAGEWEEFASYTLSPMQTVAFTDVLNDAFGVDTSASGAIVMELAEGSPLPIATSRTYNDTESAGTLGQYIPAVNLVDGGSLFTRIEGLAADDGTRSNSGIVNLSSAPLTATLTLRDSDGGPRGRSVAVQLPPLAAMQLNAINNVAEAGSIAPFSVEISSDAPHFSYASILDNRTSDPIFVPGTLSPRTLQWIDGIAAVTGAGGSFFRSSLVIANRAETNASVTMGYTPRGATAPTHNAQLMIAAASTTEFRDIRELFPIEGAGTLTISSPAAPLVAWARTFSDRGSAGTLGQFIPAFGAEDLIPLTGAILQGLSQNQRYRTNAGLVNTSEQQVNVRLSLWNRDGTRLSSRQWTIAPSQSVFIGAVLREFVDEEFSDVYVLIEPDVSDAIYGWASIVDNLSTDPTFVRPIFIP